MMTVIANGTQRNPYCQRYEIRAYRNWSDLQRAETQLGRVPHIRLVRFLEVNGPALQISLYRKSL